MPHFDKVEEFFVLDPHVLDWIEQCYPFREPALHFQHTLPDGISGLLLPQIFRQEYSNMTYLLNRRQQNWDDKWTTLGAWWARQNATWCRGSDVPVFGECSLRITVQ